MIDKIKAIKNVIFPGKQPPYPHGKFQCSVCGASEVRMEPLPAFYLEQSHIHQSVHNPFFAETINFGHYSCSNCWASDRDRLYALYLDGYFKDHKQGLKLLDIAPANALRNFIKKYPQVNYRSMDLMMDDVEDNLDITDMNTYSNEQFDFFICSHVLEHIPDDLKAIRELFRVLKKGGKGIAMVPINLLLEKTMEDPACTDAATRWKLFGQDDHVRMYAKKDFISRLESAGFTVTQLGQDHFGVDTFEKHAIFPTSVLYIVSK